MALLNYGYANCRLYTDKEEGEIPETHVAGGVKDTVKTRLNGTFSYLSTTGEDFSGIEKEWVIASDIQAPVREGDIVGRLVYRLGEKEIGQTDVVAAEGVEKAGFLDALKKILSLML